MGIGNEEFEGEGEGFLNIGAGGEGMWCQIQLEGMVYSENSTDAESWRVREDLVSSAYGDKITRLVITQIKNIRW